MPNSTTSIAVVALVVSSGVSKLHHREKEGEIDRGFVYTSATRFKYFYIAIDISILNTCPLLTKSF